ncbi:MAG: DUF4347 domain-containing protein, partial [Calothrix sp. MO_192.B10]|nr:DUF4347 domain-containing protein [Calothrix sp. MO_192.B10]
MNNTYILGNNLFVESSLVSQHSIVFIDKAVPNYESLVRGVVEGTEVVLIDPNCDGVQKITAVLAQRVGITSVHLVSHGMPGQIQLGSVYLSVETIDRYAVNIQQWSAALAPKADLVIYGCEVAQGKLGESLVWQLSELTGATVTASDTKTGSVALGGDWHLTVTTGAKAVDLAFLPMIMENYTGVLAENEPYLVSDINPTSYGSNPRNFLHIGDIFYFIADNDVNGTELWRADLNTGVVSVVEINPGSGNSNPSNLTNVNGILYFQAYDPTNGYELWKIDADGTPTRIDLGSGSSYAANLTNINGTLYFQARGYDGTDYVGYELWKIDPTTGTPSVIDIVSGRGSSSPTNLTNANGTLYFTANGYDGDTYIGRELWKLDPTTGNPVFLKDIRVGSGTSNPGNLTYSNGKLYFTADDLTHGVELWETDGTPEGTVLTQDINQNTYGSNPYNFINVGGILYFIADNDVNGTELWKSDPSTGVVSVVEINPGSGDSYPSNLTNVNGILYFQAYDPTNGYELWKIDDSGTPTRIDLGSGSSYAANLTNVNGTLYFQARGYNGADYVGYELWKIDPTTGTPSVIDINSGRGSSSPTNLTNINGILYFTASTSSTGRELWKLDPANDLPVLISDLYFGTNSSNPSNLINSGGTVYFIANNGTNGSELFRIDPTTGNPVLLDVREGASGSSPSSLIDANGSLYFIANDGVNGSELWRVDPTTGNPVLLSINTGSGSSNISNLTNVNGTLYFQAYDSTNAYQLWKVDAGGTPTRIDLGIYNSSPNYLTNINGTLYFQARGYDGANFVGYELWKIDP